MCCDSQVGMCLLTTGTNYCSTVFFRLIIILRITTSSSATIVRTPPRESELKGQLLLYYDKTTRPVVEVSTSVVVDVGLSLFHILDTVLEADFCYHVSRVID